MRSLLSTPLQHLLPGLVHDLRLAVRNLARRPGFTAAVGLLLAVGIGVSATLWSAVRTLLLAPPPAVSVEGLVEVGRGRRDGSGFDTTSLPNFRDLRRGQRSLTGLAAYTVLDEMSLTVDGESERVFGSVVSSNYFDVLGLEPARGRLFGGADDGNGGDGEELDAPGSAPWVVVGHGLWRRRFGGDPGLVGRAVQINGAPFTVVGVAPEGFRGTFGPVTPDLFVPLAMAEQARPGRGSREDRAANWLLMVGRLRPGVSVERARADLETVFSRIRRDHPEVEVLERQSVVVAPAGAVHPAGRAPVAMFLGALLGLTLLLLAVAAANAGGMVLARTWSRSRELAVRAALGAGRFRLIRQLLAETGVLLLLGAAAGLALALAATRALPRVLGPLPVPVDLELAVGLPEVLFASAAGVGAAAVFGLLPALSVIRKVIPRASERLHGGGLEGEGRSRLRSLLVGVQVALSLVLLIAGGLLVRSLEHARTLNPGFDPEGVSLVRLDLSLAGHDETGGRDLQRRLLERAAGLPGIEAAALAADLPLDLSGMGLGGISPAEAAGGETPIHDADFNVVSPAYFEVLRVPLVKGRGFGSADGGGAEPVAVINETAAERLWPGEEALGRRLRIGGPGGAVHRVVGVARDGKYRSLGEDPRSYVVLPWSQAPYRPRVSVLVRGGGPGVLADLRTVVRHVDLRLPVLQATTLERVAAGALLPQRVASTVAGLSGAVGLVLTALGLWGLVAYAVGRRTREVGLRMALGAGRGDVLRLVLGGTLRWVVGGVVVGLGAAFALSPVLATFTLGVTPLDPPTWLGVSALLLATAGLAAYGPARRALRVDPAAALRSE